MIQGDIIRDYLQINGELCFFDASLALFLPKKEKYEYN